MKIKLYTCNVKAKLEDDITKVIEYFKAHKVTLTFDIESTKVKLPEWQVRVDLALPNDGKYDVVMYAYDREEQRWNGHGITENFSKNTALVYIPTGVAEDNMELIWLIIAHELMHCLGYQQINKGNKYIDPMDSWHTLNDYVLNNEPNNPNSNFAEAWKRLSPYLQTTSYKYFTDKEIVGLKPELVKLLDFARESAGIPFVITSGFRTVEHNAEVDGVENSSHTLGEAVDLRARNSNEHFLITKALLDVGFTRVSRKYPQHIHADISKDKPQKVLF